jgi:Flp pilus assembly protein TadG
VRRSQDHNNIFATRRGWAFVAPRSALSDVVSDCGGAVALEFAFISIPLLLLLFGIFDLGVAMLTETKINFAVEAAAKCGAIRSPTCESPSETAVYGASVAAVRGLGASGFVVTTAACGVSVTASYAYNGMILPAMTLNAGACYPADQGGNQAGQQVPLQLLE